ncbi:hypothetical protein BaRGS_00025839, partial [Batillaria attramentaria]
MDVNNYTTDLPPATTLTKEGRVSPNTSFASYDLSSIPEYQASLAIWKYCPPVLLVLGGFGNVATIFVLRRINWGQSTQHVFLTALAVVDLLLLYTGLLDEWIRYALGLEIRTLHLAICKIHPWLVYALSNASAWLLTAVTVQRAMSVVWPHRMNNLCTTKISTVTVLVILLTTHALQSPYLFILHISEKRCVTYQVFHDLDLIWTWMDLFTSSLLPSLILLFCNVILASTLSRSTRNASKLGGDTANFDGRKRMARYMTITVLCLSITFLLLTLPVCVFLLWARYMGDSIYGDQIGTARPGLAWATSSHQPNTLRKHYGRVYVAAVCLCPSAPFLLPGLPELS